MTKLRFAATAWVLGSMIGLTAVHSNDGGSNAVGQSCDCGGSPGGSASGVDERIGDERDGFGSGQVDDDEITDQLTDRAPADEEAAPADDPES